MKTRTIKIRVDALSRVEGEGGIRIRLKDGKVVDHQFRIFEPPRLFEAFLRGRSYAEVPDITARICGICPVAYQMTSVQAIENAFGFQVDESVQTLRRLIYCGEWIESHALHVLFLHAPDFLGLPDAFPIAKQNPALFRNGLELKKTGNDIVALLGGREVHPVNMKVGGFYRMPHRRELTPLLEKLKRARDHAMELVRWVSGFPFPEFSADYEFVALQHPTEYPMGHGSIASSQGLNLSVDKMETVFAEEQAPHSHALHSRIQGRGGYLVGPLARFNLNFDRLSPLAREAAKTAGIPVPCTNPFQSIVIRTVEILQACEVAIGMVEIYEPPAEHDAPTVVPRAGRGFGCTEAPRGLLYHRYDLDDQGLVVESKIVPPTSQNQKSIEDDLLHLVEQNMDLDHDRLTWLCEQAVRNYDPCISCATHTLHPAPDLQKRG